PRVVRVDLHPPGLDFGPDIPIREQHAPEPTRCDPLLRAPGPATHRPACSRPPAASGKLSGEGQPNGCPSGCSSMVELQLPKLITRVRFPSSAPKHERDRKSVGEGKRSDV